MNRDVEEEIKRILFLLDFLDVLERDREIFLARYGLDDGTLKLKKQDQVAKKYGMSAASVSRIVLTLWSQLYATGNLPKKTDEWLDALSTADPFVHMEYGPLVRELLEIRKLERRRKTMEQKAKLQKDVETAPQEETREEVVLAKESEVVQETEVPASQEGAPAKLKTLEDFIAAAATMTQKEIVDRYFGGNGVALMDFKKFLKVSLKDVMRNAEGAVDGVEFVIACRQCDKRFSPPKSLRAYTAHQEEHQGGGERRVTTPTVTPKARTPRAAKKEAAPPAPPQALEQVLPVPESSPEPEPARDTLPASIPSVNGQFKQEIRSLFEVHQNEIARLEQERDRKIEEEAEKVRRLYSGRIARAKDDLLGQIEHMTKK